jgi:hypothetical protein
MKKYRRRDATNVAAVQLSLDTDGFTYRKWGGEQTCKRGDWLVFNRGDTYTVDQAIFVRTYREVSLGVYEKVTPVWAAVAADAGEIATAEGVTHYEAGEYLVFNDPEGKDGYAVTAEMFERLYEPWQ